MTLTFTPRLVLLVVAILLFLWTAFIAANAITWGTPGFLQNIGLACFAAAFLPWNKGGPA